jgi:hypothetical protein
MRDAQHIASDLRVLADHFQYWLDSQAENREREGLETTSNTYLMLRTPPGGVTPPTWPTRQSLMEIISLLKDASAALQPSN